LEIVTEIGRISAGMTVLVISGALSEMTLQFLIKVSQDESKDLVASDVIVHHKQVIEHERSSGDCWSGEVEQADDNEGPPIRALECPFVGGLAPQAAALGSRLAGYKR
jgi:hypothetical protein